MFHHPKGLHIRDHVVLAGYRFVVPQSGHDDTDVVQLGGTK